MKGFKKCCISNALDETVICCGMAVRRMGMLEVSVSKMKVLWRWRQGH